MADTLSIETRSRSRSKTPGFENGDSGKKTKKIPTISLIEEEDDVVEVAPSSQVTRTKRQRRSTKATAVDTSGDASIESPKNSQKEVTSKIVVVSSTTTVTETEVKKSTNGNEEATSTTTTTTRVDEPESQSIFNNIFNAIKTSTPILSNKRSKRISYDVSSSTANVNIADHPAYKEYREAGEYWNKYPKTDYTYSQLSPHRRELTNGMVAMPNMSRRSLEKYSERVESMIHNNPLDETYLRRKFLTNTNTSFQKRSSDLQYDSADEVDLTELRKQLQLRRKTVSNNVISRFFLSIISYLYSAYYQTKTSVQGVFGSKQSYVAYTPLRRSSKGEKTKLGKCEKYLN